MATHTGCLLGRSTNFESSQLLFSYKLCGCCGGRLPRMELSGKLGSLFEHISSMHSFRNIRLLCQLERENQWKGKDDIRLPRDAARMAT